MKNISLRLSEEMVKSIDRARGKRSRSEFIRIAVEQNCNNINSFLNDNPNLLTKLNKALKEVGL